MSKLLIVGAGGHGQVVADTAAETGLWKEIAFLDDDYPSDQIFAYPVIGNIKDAVNHLTSFPHVIIAIGDNLLRSKLVNNFEQLGFEVPTIIHPTAFVSKRASISNGTVILAKAVVNVNCIVGKSCIINTAATIDHGCIVGKGVHLSPGVHLAGNVKIGDYSWIGIGASIINNVSIGNSVIVGGGSVVINDTCSDVTLVGVPAKIIKQH